MPKPLSHIENHIERANARIRLSEAIEAVERQNAQKRSRFYLTAGLIAVSCAIYSVLSALFS